MAGRGVYIPLVGEATYWDSPPPVTSVSPRPQDTHKELPCSTSQPRSPSEVPPLHHEQPCSGFDFSFVGTLEERRGLDWVAEGGLPEGIILARAQLAAEQLAECAAIVMHPVWGVGLLDSAATSYDLEAAPAWRTFVRHYTWTAQQGVVGHSEGILETRRGLGWDKHIPVPGPLALEVNQRASRMAAALEGCVAFGVSEASDTDRGPTARTC